MMWEFLKDLIGALSLFAFGYLLLFMGYALGYN